MELWDIYDRDRNKTGRKMERGRIKDGDYHLAVHICIFNFKGEMLIQQRQPFKEGWANMWDITVGGSAISGDTSQTAAQRELFEEIGYKVDFTNKRPSFIINFDELSLQYEEVQDVRWASHDEIIKLIKEKEFLPYHKSLIDMIFDMRHQKGALRI